MLCNLIQVGHSKQGMSEEMAGVDLNHIHGAEKDDIRESADLEGEQ